MTPAMEAYDEVDGVEGFDDFESTAEAIPIRRGPKVFGTLLTPKGPAQLSLPPTVATVSAVQQALNANTHRTNAELARLRKLVLQRQDPLGQNMMPLLLTLKLSKDFKGHTHGAGGASVTLSTTSDPFSTVLPLMMFMPNLFGGGSALPGTRSPTAQDPMSMIMLMIFMDAF
jgi:hypothetical protein